jgi:hypothetical protein
MASVFTTDARLRSPLGSCLVFLDFASKGLPADLLRPDGLALDVLE